VALSPLFTDHPVIHPETVAGCGLTRLDLNIAARLKGLAGGLFLSS
jgi:hypothetical protein